MFIKTELDDLAEFDAWSGAEQTKKRIVSQGLGIDFMTVLEDNYPEGITETELNDLLWFEEEWCYKLVGLNSSGVVPIKGEDILDNTVNVERAIVEKIEDYNAEYDTEYTADELGISPYDFEDALDDWLSENQGDETDKETLAERWLEDDGYVSIERLIRDEAPDIPEADDHKHGDDDE